MNPIIQILGLVIFGIGTFWDKVEGSEKKDLTAKPKAAELPSESTAITMPSEPLPHTAIEDKPE